MAAAAFLSCRCPWPRRARACSPKLLHKASRTLYHAVLPPPAETLPRVSPPVGLIRPSPTIWEVPRLALLRGGRRPMGSLSATLEPLQYPPARRDESVVDDYHGVKVPDPYRWLEDPDAEEVKEFVEKQADLTESLLQTCEEREKLRREIMSLMDHPRYDTPFRRGNKYFYSHNTGLQAQSVLYVQEGIEGKGEVLLDPNVLSDDGTTALSTYSVSQDAKYLAYGLSASGSDWVTINVMRVDDKKPEPDSLSWVKFSSISWTHDSRGFFYSRYPAPKNGEDLDAGTETNINLNHELYYHFLGTDQSEDLLCWRDPENPKHLFSGQVTEDGKVSVREALCALHLHLSAL